MAISHADHDHPNTPAARAACRKLLATGTTHQTVENSSGDRKPAKWTVVPSARSKATADRLAARASNLGLGPTIRAMKAAAGTMIKTPGDVPANFPASLMYAITTAWDRGYGVVRGYALNDAEERILIGGTVAQVSIVWDADGRTGMFVRHLSSSVSHRADSAQAAMGLAAGDDTWPWNDLPA